MNKQHRILKTKSFIKKILTILKKYVKFGNNSHNLLKKLKYKMLTNKLLKKLIVH